MDNEITMVRVFDTDIVAKEYQGRMVVSFKDIDLCHKRPVGTARKRFNDNKAHFIEGVDFFKISPSEFRTAFGENSMGKKQSNDITLATESGYLMIVKSFTDDLAWEVQRMLVNSYFRMKKLEEVAIEQHEQIEEKNQAIELYKSLIFVLSDLEKSQFGGLEAKYIGGDGNVLKTHWIRERELVMLLALYDRLWNSGESSAYVLNSLSRKILSETNSMDFVEEFKIIGELPF